MSWTEHGAAGRRLPHPTDGGAGRYLSANDVLPAGMMRWLAYVVEEVGRHLRGLAPAERTPLPQL